MEVIFYFKDVPLKKITHRIILQLLICNASYAEASNEVFIIGVQLEPIVFCHEIQLAKNSAPGRRLLNVLHESWAYMRLYHREMKMHR